MKKNILFKEKRTYDLPIRKVWSLLADSNQLNEYVGLFPVQFSTFIEVDSVLVRRSEAKPLGIIATNWLENVFEWVKYESYTIERVYSKGPVGRALWTVSLESLEETVTVVHLTGNFSLNNPLGNLVVKFIILPQLRKTFDYIIAFKQNEEQRPVSVKMKKSIHVNESRLETLLTRMHLTGKESSLTEALVHTILTSTDDELNSMQPYVWAHQHGFDRQAVIGLFLKATNVGILDLEWSLMCPNCRVPKGRASSLKSLEQTVHCDLCGIHFEVDFDRYIEMRFSINPGVRKTQYATYCVNGPMNSPHVLAQFRIPPQAKKKLILPEWKQPLRWRILKDNGIVEIDGEQIEPKASIIFADAGFEQQIVPKATLVDFANETSKEIVLVLEEVEWDRFALTARDVTSMQLFRDHFATEVLSTDTQIGISKLTLLFTDLKSSTQLYASIGDAPAYSNVKKHFDFMAEIIKKNEGAIVKTIGDSVMAVFTDEVSAMKASICIQQNIREFNDQLTTSLQVKIGFHSGPVIAVNANEILDYFGGTVNMAARIQQEGIGDDIVISEEVFEELILSPEITELLKTSKLVRFSTKLHGLQDTIPLVRISVN